MTGGRFRLGALSLAPATALPATALPATVARARVPVLPDRDQARLSAIQELSHREYRFRHPSLLAQAVQWLIDHLQPRLPGGPGSGLGLVVLLLVLAAVLGYAIRRAGGFGWQRRGAPAEEVFAGARLTAAQHRAAAERAEAERDWTSCVLERFRAVVRELDERALVTVQPGRTADELARDAGSWLPELGPELLAGARLFDDVRYGDRPAAEPDAAMLRSLDERVRAARPRSEPVPQAGGPAVPT